MQHSQRITRSRVPTLGILAALAACGGGDPEPDPDPIVTTYEGVMAIGSESSAAITLVSRVPPAAAAGAAGVTPTEPGAAADDATATGTITSSDLGTVQLSGDYDTATRTFTLQGSGYQITANVQGDNTVKGTGTLGTTTLSLVAVPSTASSPSVQFCGRYNGTYTGPGGAEPGTGLLSITIQGTESGPGRFYVRGFAENYGDPVHPTVDIEGTAFLSTGRTPSTLGSSLAYIVLRLIGPPSSDVDGNWENGGWHGNYWTTDGVGSSSGVWAAWEC